MILTFDEIAADKQYSKIGRDGEDESAGVFAVPVNPKTVEYVVRDSSGNEIESGTKTLCHFYRVAGGKLVDGLWVTTFELTPAPAVLDESLPRGGVVAWL